MFHSPDTTSKIPKYFLPQGELNLGLHTMSTMEYENENGRYDGTSNVRRMSCEAANHSSGFTSQGRIRFTDDA